MPLLSNPSFADFSQQIGIISLGVSDEDIIKLSTVLKIKYLFMLCVVFDAIAIDESNLIKLIR